MLGCHLDKRFFVADFWLFNITLVNFHKKDENFVTLPDIRHGYGHYYKVCCCHNNNYIIIIIIISLGGFRIFSTAMAFPKYVIGNTILSGFMSLGAPAVSCTT